MPGLGKGLDSLIPSEGFAPEPISGVTQAPLERIIPNPRQPRARFSQEELEELAASIREHGIIQPLIVTRDDVSERYVLIAGERRLQAARLAGLESVPVLVRQATDQQRLELALIENVQRADLNPLEEAHAYQQLAEEFKLSQEVIAARVGKSRVAISNTLRLLRLPSALKQALVDGAISEGHARALLGLPTDEAMEAALRSVLAHGYNVRQTEELVRKYSGEKPAPRLKSMPSPDVVALEERLRVNLGTRVDLRAGKKGQGTITLHFYSNEELDTLLARLGLHESA